MELTLDTCATEISDLMSELVATRSLYADAMTQLAKQEEFTSELRHVIEAIAHKIREREPIDLREDGAPVYREDAYVNANCIEHILHLCAGI